MLHRDYAGEYETGQLFLEAVVWPGEICRLRKLGSFGARNTHLVSLKRSRTHHLNQYRVITEKSHERVDQQEKVTWHVYA